jgi:hypothetical protein
MSFFVKLNVVYPNFVIRMCVVMSNVVAPSSVFRHKQAKGSLPVIILNGSASFGRKPSDRQTFDRRSLWQIPSFGRQSIGRLASWYCVCVDQMSVGKMVFDHMTWDLLDWYMI